ncbi:hypothetical protein GCM10023215_19690 [Pseudonocardia yuanmonensis]|uniref:Uncharacterized protein n=1 Tax=Pseudonocardia yuanmonensis TaxID=1095914 RepID=A0ABP8WA94_9PSEU
MENENEERAGHHARLAEEHVAEDDAAAHASLAAYYAALETNELLRQVLARPVPAIGVPTRPGRTEPPSPPGPPGPDRPPLRPPQPPPIYMSAEPTQSGRRV